MTAYNRAEYIADAIRSVISSTYQNWELVICDDGSTDETYSIACEFGSSEPRIRVYQNEKNLGDYANRNKVAGYAIGKYLKYLDSDDYMYPWTLEKMVWVLEVNPEVALAVSSRYAEVKEGTVNILSPEGAYKQHFFSRNVLDHGPSATIMRKDVFDELGGFLTLRNVSDFDMWLRLAARHTIAEIESGLVFWREHPGQEINIANDLYLKHSYSILKKNLLSKDCPLNTSLVKFILLRQKKMVLINLINYYKRTKNLSKVEMLLNENNFHWIDFLKLPFLKVYTSPRVYTPKLYV